MHDGADSFDSNQIFDAYHSRRHRSDSPNESLEKPVFMELLGEVVGKQVLDLGCGDGLFARKLYAAGCGSYVGIDASHRMVQAAWQELADTTGQVVHTKIEEWAYPPEQFDRVISRLALHYVADLDETFAKVHGTLKTNGRFIFSIVHPVITSSDKSRESGGKRQDWIVDDYFSPGPRKVHFQGETVRQYHRTVEDIYRSLLDANFRIEQLRESRPRAEHFADAALYERRKRIPLFLFLSASKG